MGNYSHRNGRQLSATNQNRDTTFADYLVDVKTYLGQIKAKSFNAVDATLTTIKQLVSSAAFATPAPTATSYSLGNYDVTNNKSKLVAYIPCQLDVNDASNSNHGTVTGTETYVTGPEISPTHKIRKAFSFNGSSYITCANESNFDFEYTNNFSISLWVKSSTSGTAEDLITKQNGSTSVGWRIGITSSNTVNFVLRTSGTAYSATSTSTNLHNGLWRHIVGTYGGGDGSPNQDDINIYVDGILENTGSSSAISATILNNISPILGANGDTTRKLTGQLAEVQVWNVELTQSDVDRLYAGKQVNRDTSATNPAYIGMSDIA